jgi:leucyl/phenylalanyl-tRNA--protein transferase
MPNAGTWITDAMLEVYCRLHEAGYAHSIECWFDNRLVGGMYGLVLGDIFFGESMFSKMKDASKVAMYHLCTNIKPFLIDAQVYSDHLQTLGAKEIPREEFVDIVQSHLDHSLVIRQKF